MLKRIRADDFRGSWFLLRFCLHLNRESFRGKWEKYCSIGSSTVMRNDRREFIWLNYFYFTLAKGKGTLSEFKLVSGRKKVNFLRCVWLFVTLGTVTCQAPPSMGFSRKEYWNGLSFPPPGDLPNPEIESGSPALQADSLLSEPKQFV